MFLLRLITRRSLFFLLMTAAIGVPYAATHDWSQSVAKLRERVSASRGGAEPLSLPASYTGHSTEPPPIASGDAWNQADRATGGRENQAAPTMVGPRRVALDQVFRFDVTPDWVTRNWARVTPIQTGEFYGMRVALVTGGAADDVAGSLTYYFDDRHQVQRLTFRGVCGSERKLVAFATRKFRLQPEPSTAAAGLYVARWNRRPTSVLRVEHATVVRADDPLGQKRLRMEINRPRAYLRMSREMELWMAEQQPAKEKWRW